MKLSIVEDDDQVLPTAKTLTQESRPIHKNGQGVDQEQVRDADVVRGSDEHTEKFYNQTELAKLFDISRNAVIDILKEHGVEPVEQGQGGPRGKRYRLSDVQDIHQVHQVGS
jgi:hypothetical protein